MVNIIKKLIIVTYCVTPISSFADLMSLRAPVPTKEGFNCDVSCKKSTCSSQLNTAAACVAWCAAEDYEGCWKGAIETIDFQKTLTANTGRSHITDHKAFLDPHAKLSPARKKDLYLLFQQALEISQSHKNNKHVPETLTKKMAEQRLNKGPEVLNELQTIHHEEEKELRGALTRVP
jgi:hypothetical protein